MRVEKKKIGKIVLDEVYNVLLALLFSISYVLFVIPNDYAPTGISGICTMIQYKTGVSLGYLSLLINVPFCVFTFFTVNREFAIKSLIFTIVYSISYLLFSEWSALEEFIYRSPDSDTILPCIIGGILSGLVYGFTFKINSSTGGVDHISRFVNKKNPMFNFFWITFIINFAVACESFFVFGKGGAEGYKPVVLSALYAFMSSFIGDLIIKGGNTAYKFFVVTAHAEEISREIVEVLHHSATSWEGVGAYTGAKKKVLVCVVNKGQLEQCRNIVRKYDETFTFVETVNETIGFFPKIK